MREFKVGDRVKVITDRYGQVPVGDHNTPQLGLIGTVIRTYAKQGFGIEVQFSDHVNQYAPEDLVSANAEILKERLRIK